MSIILTPFQLLELNIISAQDLAPVSRPLRTYAVTWVHRDRKLSTRIDTHGDINPTWNDKFVFRVNEEFLYADTSAIMIEIYAVHWFKDIHVGTVRVLVSNLVTPPSRSFHNHHPPEGMQFVALQVRRPSGRPQGILNIGVTVLDSSMRSMPLYTHSPSAVGYRHLMGEKDAYNDHNHTRDPQLFGGGNGKGNANDIRKPQLRRTKSDSSSMISSKAMSRQNRIADNKKVRKASSLLDSAPSEASSRSKTKSQSKSTASSVDIVKSREFVQTSSKKDDKKDEKKNDLLILCESNSLLSSSQGTVMSSEATSEKKFDYVDEIQRITPRTNNVYEVKASPRLQFRNSPVGSKFMGFGGSHKGTPRHTPLYAFGRLNNMPFEYSTPRMSNLRNLGPPIMTESELGPSPSEVAAAIARQPQIDEGENSTVGGWSMDKSVEGLQSKLDRWKTELPPVYDCGDISSLPSMTPSSSKINRTQTQRTESGSGLFSCFSNICGCQCSIVYSNGNAKKKAATFASARRRRTPSMGSTSFA